MHPWAISAQIFYISTTITEIIFIPFQQDILPNQILKKSLAMKIDYFFKILKEKAKNKRRLINVCKRKLGIDKSKSKTTIISTLNNIYKEDLPIIALKAKLLILVIKEIDVAIIDMHAYHIVCKLRGA